jgi:hypothetical protein
MNNNHKECKWIIRYRNDMPILYCKDHNEYIKILSPKDADELKIKGIEMAPIKLDISNLFDEE